MYSYVSDVNKLSHYIIKNFCNKFDTAVDATLGNGHDTDFLSENFSKIYSFDIQKFVIDSYKERKKDNVILINNSHHALEEFINEKVNCIMYNLGFLPGGNKSITTICETTLKSLKSSFNIIDKGGIITIALYRGHEEGKKEEKEVLKLVENLPKEKYGVMLHSFINRDNNPPFLIVIEKK